MIELTQQQLQSLLPFPATPPCVVNPNTQEKFVLVPLSEYQRLKAEDYDAGDWTEEERSLLRLEACEMLDSFGK